MSIATSIETDILGAGPHTQIVSLATSGTVTKNYFVTHWKMGNLIYKYWKLILADHAEHYTYAYQSCQAANPGKK